MRVPPAALARHVDVAEWTQAPVYETGGCRFDPCRRRTTPRARMPAGSPKAGCHVRLLAGRHTEGGAQRWATGVESPARCSLRVRLLHLPPRRDGPVARTPGPQPGSRGSTPRRGTQPLPGSRAVRRRTVTPKAGVRAPLWQPPQHSREETAWPWSNGRRSRGAKPEDEGSTPSGHTQQ